MIIRTPQSVIDQYFNEEDHVSRSILKSLLSGVDGYKSAIEKAKKNPNYFYEEEEHFVIGNAVDVLLTQGEEAFKEKFYLSALIEKPSDAIISIMQEVADELVSSRTPEEIELLPDSLSLFSDKVLKACRNHNWNSKWGDEAVVKNAIASGNDYFKEVIRSLNKQIISLEEKVIVDSIVNSLKTHEATKDLFENNEENYYIIYQRPFYTMVDGVKCKVLPDIVVIDSAGYMTVFDVKTTGDSVIKFGDQAQKLRYDLQAAFYLDVITRFLSVNNQELNIEIPAHIPENLPEDTEVPPDFLTIKVNAVQGFRFVVESKTSSGNPAIYHASTNFLNIGKFGRERLGFVDPSNADAAQLTFTPIYGYKYLLELYKWHLENGFDVDRVIKMTNHNLNLDWNIKPL